MGQPQDNGWERQPGRDESSPAGADQLREAEERFRLAFDHAPIGMALVALDGRFLRVNRSLCEIVGYPADRLMSLGFQDITHPDDLATDLDLLSEVLEGRRRTYQLEKRYVDANGRTVWVMLNVSLVRSSSGEPRYFISQIEDVTDRRAMLERLEYLATHDEMTGLFNRRRFDEELTRQVTYAKRYGREGAVLMLDLDSFKEINDSLGHQVGDQLVRRVADRLRSRVRESDVIARIGGDEFALYLPETDANGAANVARDILRRIAEEPVVLGAMPLWTRASIGIAMYDPTGEDTAGELLMRADTAMYEAKAQGGHRFVLHGSSERIGEVA